MKKTLLAVLMVAVVSVWAHAQTATTNAKSQNETAKPAQVTPATKEKPAAGKETTSTMTKEPAHTSAHATQAESSKSSKTKTESKEASKKEAHSGKSTSHTSHSKDKGEKEKPEVK